MTIIGVSDEPAGKVKPYIEANGIKYVIALGGAAEYKTQGVPHAWVVSPRGTIEWEGHPADIKDELLEPYLKDVNMAPTFSLQKELKTAEKQLNAGKYGDGLKALEAALKKPKSDGIATAAKEAIDRVKAYAASRLAQVEQLAKEREYGEAAEILKSLETGFKGTEHATKAKDTLAEWKKDKAIKLELDGGAILVKADALVQAKQYRNAAQLLLGISKGKKYEGTKVREVAEKKLATIERKL